jgi:hypothetical protein
VNIPPKVLCTQWKTAINNRSDTPPPGAPPTIALCTPPWGLRRPPHRTHRTCQRVRRVGTVDVGDVVDSVLWGERGDDDDNCDRRGFFRMSIDDCEAGSLGNVLPVGQDSDQGQRASIFRPRFMRTARLRLSKTDRQDMMIAQAHSMTR